MLVKLEIFSKFRGENKQLSETTTQFRFRKPSICFSPWNSWVWGWRTPKPSKPLPTSLWRKVVAIWGAKDDIPTDVPSASPTHKTGQWAGGSQKSTSYIRRGEKLTPNWFPGCKKKTVTHVEGHLKGLYYNFMYNDCWGARLVDTQNCNMKPEHASLQGAKTSTPNHRFLSSFHFKLQGCRYRK